MADEYADPSGDTQAFRAFAQAADPVGEQSTGRQPMIIGAVLLGVLLLAVVAWLALG